jgi:hypothetical protein
MGKNIGHQVWTSLSGVCDFMKSHFRRYFASIISYTIVAYIVSALLGFLVAARFLVENGNFGGEFFLSFFYHITGTAKYIGIICASLLAMALSADMRSDDNEKFKVLKSLKKIDSKGWIYFSGAFFLIFLINFILYKDVFTSGYSGGSFQDLNNSDFEFQLVLYPCLNALVDFIKSCFPYLLGGLAYLGWRVSDFKSNWRSYRTSIATILFLCYVADAVFIQAFYELYSIVFPPFQLLFKSQVFIRLFGSIIFIPFISFFMLLFSVIFISVSEQNPELDALKKDEELLFPLE